LPVSDAPMHIYSSQLGERMMTRQEVRDFDSWAINQMGIPGVVLMENAGRSCSELILASWPAGRPRVTIFCGTGNNGGDGYVIARHLAGNGSCVKVCICSNRDKIAGDAKINLDILTKTGLIPTTLPMEAPGLAGEVMRLTDGCDVLVDAIFGTGLRDKLPPDFVRLIEAINASSAMKVAIDIPSGLDCDTGKPMPLAVKADMTVTFVAAKKGFAVAGAAAYTGKVYVASIGIEPA
jgi:NAD(P)H-hydrate epimerase